MQSMTATEYADRYRDALDEWMESGSADAADNLGEIENDVCRYLEIPLNETEQGLTDKAVAIIDNFVAKNATPRER